jgi:hypothetical protein
MLKLLSLVSASGDSQSVHLVLSPRGGSITTDSLKNLFQSLNLCLGNPELHFAVGECIFAKDVRMVDRRCTFYVQIEPERSDALRSPSVKRLGSRTFHNLGSLPEVKVAISFAVDEGLLFVGHPETQAEIRPESNWFVAEPDRGFCLHPHDQADGFYDESEAS